MGRSSKFIASEVRLRSPSWRAWAVVSIALCPAFAGSRSRDRWSRDRLGTDPPKVNVPTVSVPRVNVPTIASRRSTCRPSASRGSTYRPSASRGSMCRPSASRKSMSRKSTSRPSTSRRSTHRRPPSLRSLTYRRYRTNFNVRSKPEGALSPDVKGSLGSAHRTCKKASGASPRPSSPDRSIGPMSVLRPRPMATVRPRLAAVRPRLAAMRPASAVRPRPMAAVRPRPMAAIRAQSNGGDVGGARYYAPGSQDREVHWQVQQIYRKRSEVFVSKFTNGCGTCHAGPAGGPAPSVAPSHVESRQGQGELFPLSSNVPAPTGTTESVVLSKTPGGDTLGGAPAGEGPPVPGAYAPESYGSVTSCRMANSDEFGGVHQT